MASLNEQICHSLITAVKETYVQEEVNSMNFFLVIMSDIQHHVIINVFSNPLSGNFTKWSNTLKQFVGNLPTNILGVFDHFVGSALKGLRTYTRTNLIINITWIISLKKSPYGKQRSNDARQPSTEHQ